jgi:hypothetical protein
MSQRASSGWFPSESHFTPGPESAVRRRDQLRKVPRSALSVQGPHTNPGRNLDARASSSHQIVQALVEALTSALPQTSRDRPFLHRSQTVPGFRESDDLDQRRGNIRRRETGSPD